MKNLTKNYANCYNTPRLNDLLNSKEYDNETVLIIKNILTERENEFFNVVTETAEFHETK